MNGFNINENMLSEIKLPKEVSIRQFAQADFPMIKALYAQEGWMTFINRESDALEAWNSSNISLVAVEDDKVVGLVRGLTDGKITTYIAELIVDARYRGKGIGKALLDACHALYPLTRFDLLSTEGADEFYKSNKLREIIGFRKSYY